MHSFSSHQQMQSKTTVGEHGSLAGRAELRTKGDTKCWQGCGGPGMLLRCRWEHKSVQSLRKSAWRYPPKQNTCMPDDPAISLLVHTQHRGISVLLSTKRNIHECCVHSSFIYSGLEAETAHFYQHENGSTVGHSHCGIYCTVTAKNPLLIYPGNFPQVDLSGVTQGRRIKLSCKGGTENRGHCCNPSLLANSKPAF